MTKTAIAKKVSILALVLLSFALLISFLPFGNDEKAAVKEKSVLLEQLDELNSLPPAVDEKIAPEVKDMVVEALYLSATANDDKEARERRKIEFVVKASDSVSDEVRRAGGTVVDSTASIDGKSEYSVVQVDADKVVELAAEGSVVRIIPNAVFYATLDESVPLIKADAFWNAGYKGSGVKVAVVDTGIDKSNPILQGKVAAEKDFTNTGNTNDLCGHGTHVAGIIAGTKASGGLYDGVAPGAQLISVKALTKQPDGSCGGTFAGILAGMKWAIDPDANPATDDGAKVISMSLGAAADISSFTDFDSELKAIVDKGVVIVVSSGNCGSGCPDFISCGSFRSVTYPGSSSHVITVGAVNNSKNVACFSSGGVVTGVGIKPDFAAPGVGIKSSVPGGSYAAKSGTSMAAPHVSGAVALMLSKSPQLKQDDVKRVLEKTALDLGDIGKDTGYGFGLIDLAKALIYKEGLEFSIGLEGQVINGNTQRITVTIFDDIHINSVTGAVTKPNGVKSADIAFTGVGSNVYAYDYTDTELMGNYVVDIAISYGGATGSSGAGSEGGGEAGSGSGDVPSVTAIGRASFKVTSLSGDFGNVQDLSISQQQKLSSNLTGTLTFANTAGVVLNFSALLQLFSNSTVAQEIRLQPVTVAANSKAAVAVNNALEVGPGNYTLKILTDYGAGSLVNVTNITVADDLPPRILGLDYKKSIRVNDAQVITVQFYEHGSVNGRLRLDRDDGYLFTPITAGYSAMVIGESGYNKTLAFTIFNGSDDSGADVLKVGNGYSVALQVCDSSGNCAGSLDSPRKDAEFSITGCAGKGVLLVKSFDDASVFEEAAAADSSVCLSVLNKSVSGTPPGSYLEKFNAVVWTTGTDLVNVDSNDAAALSDYYSKKGKVAVEGSDVAFRHGQDAFMHEILHSELKNDLGFTVLSVSDMGNLSINVTRQHPILYGLSQQLPFNATLDPFPDAVQPYNGSVELASWSGLDTGGSAMVAYESDDGKPKSLLLPFSIAALKGSDAKSIAANVLKWLVEGSPVDIIPLEIRYGGEYPLIPKKLGQVCAMYCREMWSLKSGNCEFTSCGSGCGADNVTTFFREDECELARQYYKSGIGRGGIIEGEQFKALAIIGSTESLANPPVVKVHVDAGAGGVSEGKAEQVIPSGSTGGGGREGPDGMCGGIAGFSCPKGHECVYGSGGTTPSYPDEAGTCAKFVKYQYAFNANLPAGRHTVSVLANSDFSIKEKNYANNIKDFALTVYPKLPDLTLSGFSYSYSKELKTAKATLTASNLGGSSAKSTVEAELKPEGKIIFDDQTPRCGGIAGLKCTENLQCIYSDGSTKPTAYDELGWCVNETDSKWFVPKKQSVDVELAPGEVKYLTFTFDLPQCLIEPWLCGWKLPSAYNFTAVIDPEGKVGEYNESNNKLSARIYLCSKEKVLVVDDNDAEFFSTPKPSSSDEFLRVLRDRGYCIEGWSEKEKGTPPSDFMAGFPIVVWSAGDYFNGTISSEDALAIGNYTGSLLLEGSDLGLDHIGNDFFQQLTASVFSSDMMLNETENESLLLKGHPITDGIGSISISREKSPYPDGVEVADTGGEVVAEWQSGNAAITANAGGRKTAYYAFSVDGVTEEATMENLVLNTVAWLLKRPNSPPLIQNLSDGASVEVSAEAIKVTMSEGQTKNFSVVATDSDGDQLTYKWLLNGTLVSDKHYFAFSPKYNESGSYNITIIVSDGQAEARAELLVTVLDTMGCDPARQTMLCQLQSGVCAGSNVTCNATGKWPVCTAATYLGHSSKYEANEINCDGLDNDCDGKIDEGFGDVDDDEIADCVDKDNDNDDVEDDEDDLIGNESSINFTGENKNVKIEVEEDKNDKDKKLKHVRINNSGKPLLQFNYNFSKGNILLRNLTIEKQKNDSEEGFTLVRGLDLKGKRKQVFVDRLVNGSNAVCIKDKEVSAITEVTSGCGGGNETLLKCDFPTSGPPYARTGWTCGQGGSGITNTLYEGETGTYTLANREFIVTAVFVGPVSAKFTLNDKLTPTLKEGDTYSSQENSYSLQVIDITSEEFGGGSRKVKFQLSVSSPPKDPSECEPLFCQYIKETRQYQIFGLKHSAVMEACTDADLDIYLPVGCSGGTDCNDNNASISPVAAEVCNNVDDNCNGLVDENRVCNTAPVLQQIGNKTVSENSAISFAVAATDNEGDNLAYNATSLPAGAGFDNATAAFTWTPGFTQSGVYAVAFNVSDGLAYDYEKINITVTNVNRLPRFENVTNQTVLENSSLKFFANVTDPDGDALQFTVEVPPAMVAAKFSTAAMEFSWKSTFDDAGTHTVRIIATDGQYSAAAEANITVLNVNRAPVITLIVVDPPELVMGEGEIKTFSADIADADDDTVTVAWKVNGETVSTQPNMEFSPEYNGSGEYTVELSISDYEATTTTTMQLTVQDTLECGTSQTRLCPQQLGVCEASFETCSSPGHWPGCAPSDYGSSYSLEEKFCLQQPNANGCITLCDSRDNDCDGNVDEERVCNTAPVFQAIGNRTVNENSGLAFAVTATDGESDILSYNASGLPLNASFGNSSKAFEWTPSFEQAGVYAVRFSAGDGLLSGSEEINVTVVNVNRAPLIAPVGNQTVNENSTLKFKLDVSEPDNDALAVEAVNVSGNTTGFTFDRGAHIFTWAPSFEQSGSYGFMFTASDGNLSVHAQFNVTVLDVNRAPYIGSIQPDPPGLVMGEGETKRFRLVPEIFDPDGDKFVSLWYVNGGLLSNRNDYFSFAAGFNGNGTYNITLVATDNLSAATTAVMQLTVQDTMQCEPLREKKPCGLQLGVCAGSMQKCNSSGNWPGCTATDYLGYSGKYEGAETACDGLDNDCDGQVDEAPICTLRNNWTDVSGKWSVSEEGFTPLWRKDYAEHALIVEKNESFEDVQLKARVKINFSSPEVGLCGRLSPDGKGYCVSYGWGMTRQVVLSRLNGRNNDGSLQTPVQMAAGSPIIVGSNPSDEGFYLKLQLNGNTLKGKVWPVGSPEPEWQVGSTAYVMGEPLSSGFAGYYAYNVNATFGYYSAEVPGDSRDESWECSDSDGDGQQDAGCGGTDCDDNNETVYVGAGELCNGADDDCDAEVDEGCALGSEAGEWNIINGNWAYDGDRMMPISYGYGGHPVIVRNDGNFSNGTISVTATNFGGKNEMGLCGRMSADGKGYCLGYGGGGLGYVKLARFDGFPYNPATIKIGPDIGVRIGQPYRMKLLLNGSAIKGKVWHANGDEPDWQVQDRGSRYTTGTAGYYTYYTNATFEGLDVSRADWDS